MKNKWIGKRNILGLVFCMVFCACQNGVEDDRYVVRPFNQDNRWDDERDRNHHFDFIPNFPTNTNKATLLGYEYLPGVPDSLANTFTGFITDRNITIVIDRRTGSVTYRGRFFQDSFGGVTIILNLGTLILR